MRPGNKLMGATKYATALQRVESQFRWHYRCSRGKDKWKWHVDIYSISSIEPLLGDPIPESVEDMKLMYLKR